VEQQIILTGNQQVKCFMLDELFTVEDLSLPKMSSYSSLEIEKLVHLLDTKTHAHMVQIH